MKKALLLKMLLLHILTAAAQEPFYIHYQTFDERDGYRMFETPQFITQDNTGLLWIGGDNGLFSFDGTHFRNYRYRKNDSSSLPANFVLYNYQDKTGMYWTAVPRQGLYNFHPRTGTFSRFQYSNQNEFNIHEQDINLPIETKDGTLWFPLPGFGLARYDRKQNKMIPYKICPPRSCGSYYNASMITSLAEDPKDSSLWAVSNDGLINFFPADGKFIVYRDKRQKKENGIIAQVYISIFFDKQERLWLGSWGFGLKQFDRKAKQFREHRWLPVVTGTKNICFHIRQHDDHHLWINTEAGLMRFNIVTEEFTPVRLSGNAAGSLLANQMVQNSNGVLWLANQKNVFHINPAENHFNFYSVDKLFNKVPTAKDVHSFIRHGNSIYFGVVHDGFFAEYNFQDHRYRRYTLFKKLNAGVRCFATDKRQNIWIGTSLGITIFNPHTKSFKQPDPPKEAPGIFRLLTYAVLHDEDGSAWLGTEQGLIHYNLNEKKILRFQYDTLSIKKVWDNKYYTHTYTLFKDSKGNIWFGNAVIGLGCYRKSTGKIHFFNSGRNRNYPESSVASITEAKDGSILFTLEHLGLGVLKNPFSKMETITVLNSSDGLPSDDIFRVFKDRRNNIWLFTTNGLCWLDLANGQIRRFGKEEGLAETVLYSKPYQDEEENIYIGFTRSFQFFNPQKLLALEDNAGLVYLASLHVNGTEWPVNANSISSLKLNHKQNNITFDFAFLSRDHIAGFQYAYRLDGLDKLWNSTGTKTSGQYNNLSPGKYKLRIRAMNRKGKWSQNEYVLRLIIRPPWYRTGVFYAFITLATVGIVFLFFQYRLDVLRQEGKIKADFTKKIHQTEMRALRAQMNPHFIFNCLNSINRYIVKSDHKTASNYLTKFARLIRSILDNSANETITLDKEIQTLQLYIDMEILRFDNVFDYSIDIEKGLVPETISIPSMLLQPYVENAIWHGLLHKEECDGKLCIRFRQPTEDLLIAEVEDNGIGREKAKELKSKEAIKKKSYGMQISKDRIFLINEIYNMSAKVQVEDLRNTQGNAKGTKITLEIPIRNL